MTQFSKKKKGQVFFLRFLKRAVLDQPTENSGGVSRGRSVAVSVGCWLFACQWHFNNTSTALPRHFYSTSTVLPRRFQGRNKIKNNFYRGFYPHWSIESMFPVCGIFSSTGLCSKGQLKTYISYTEYILSKKCDRLWN